jgi:hypothetical protein
VATDGLSGINSFVQDRIVELRRVPAAALVPHPQNWRRHGPDQQAAMRGLLDQLGYVNALLVRPLAHDTYEVLDGHMRLALEQGATHIPVLVLDVTEDEAALILATHDQIGALSLPDPAYSDALAREVWSENEAINTVLRDLLHHGKPVAEAKAQPPDVHLALAPQPYEHYDYVVVLARNTFDFHRLCFLLHIERQDYTVPGGARKVGLGRCIDAATAIALLEHTHETDPQ